MPAWRAHADAGARASGALRPRTTPFLAPLMTLAKDAVASGGDMSWQSSRAQTDRNRKRLKAEAKTTRRGQRGDSDEAEATKARRQGDDDLDAQHECQASFGWRPILFRALRQSSAGPCP